MPTEVGATENVAERIAALGLRVPTHLALLPRNWADSESVQDLVHEASAATIRKLWREADLPETAIEARDQPLPYMLERSDEWIGPTIFFGSLLLVENQHAVTVAIEIIKQVVMDYFRGRSNPPSVRLEVIVETTKSKNYKRISYSGPAEGLGELPGLIRESTRNDGT